MELEFLLARADPNEMANDGFPYTLQHRDGVCVIDWEPAVRALLAQPQLSVATASVRFHNMLVTMAVDVARTVRARVQRGEGEENVKNVALSGGCFQNRYLTEQLVSRLLAAGYHPYWHQRVPPNDGGLALGQIMAAQLQKD
jgi:hydrogenase maturation protein HypF